MSDAFKEFAIRIGAFVLLSPLILGTVGPALSDMAFAQDGSGDRRMASFQAADANHDGRVSQDEFEAFARARMASSGGMRAAMFSRLAPEDQKARLDEKFAQMDTSGKGYLTPDDWHPQS
ncbi:EF-hand domain-containing protein [Gluconacetobacter aggeris]|uniref:EF-hand domain-containing protein n=1 Tax=Gluconacetobacter aggeris TaxID=1286186 RepID=A0A7W4ISP4_9PROT|nr:EF-hand domain-containing protein [Gluconacetobacter aggeris]MBB2168331.1 EF-hand domain-containing protein [Gluconacetobacter aggeris]